MTREAVGIWLIVLVLYEIAFDVSGRCPSLCECGTWYNLQHASCTGRHLYSIHTGASNIVQALDLSNNSISVLNNYELAEAGLTRLKYLNLSVNAISEIGLNAFNGLSELTVLDLSKNHLYYLLSDIFMPVKSLRVLRLSKNNFNSHVPKLECPWLMDLTLDSCQISYVPADTFIGLSRLRTLDLSNNLLIQLDTVALETLQFLRRLSIEGNPWTCDKLTFDLQIYLMRKNIQYHAICVKNVEPKKFEKMIVYNPQVKYKKHRPLINLNSNIMENMTNKHFTSTPGRENACATTTNESNFMKMLNSISPYWFLIAGFILGIASGMISSYVWITRKICCSRQTDNDAQNISLLQNPWLFEDSPLNDTAISCPDTPPPPYRDVVLRPGLYCNVSVNTNLNNNVATNSTEYT
ncbi:PREDICTED: leucine-rich repeat-containing protein 52-like [Cyphomyrmex costatus]|uniref:Immunoglobulin superfamily member 10 n=1 Tax=Cyphomyrmex costatus TaxID=456900 RepID=A0A195C2V8_9HYME|nr:PREDICTED: leucine-rich repeat-containing protein 52-like [Cyphomyrmex costatus]KYM95172.1 Immunoglobulin superfamily member 10 [Cyphomyrmex costatus]